MSSALRRTCLALALLGALAGCGVRPDARQTFDAGWPQPTDSGPPAVADAGWGASQCVAITFPSAYLDDAGAADCPLPDGGVQRTNLLSDRDNCGACGFVCWEPVCIAGSCSCGGCEDDLMRGLVACPSPDGPVATSMHSTSSCGGCGRACPWGYECDSTAQDPWVGVCNLEDPVGCPDGGKLCGGTCLDVMHDPANCGACGYGCCSGQCSDGWCVPPESWGACVVDGGH